MKQPYIISSFILQRLTLRVCLLCAFAVAMLTGSSGEAYALPADHYAQSSRLASGKWVKVRVEQTGVQFISAANLRKFGFSNPSAVRVYGFGGREINGAITSSDPDDLPKVASVSSDKGLWFFGFDHIRWSKAASSNSATPFSHKMNSYAEESWYFLSDSDPEDLSLEEFATSSVDSSLPVIDSFIQPLLYENDLVHPSDTGARYLGEDFRSPTRRSFEFSLTDYAEGETAAARVAFATNTSATSSLSVSSSVGAVTNPSVSFSGITDSESFMRYTASIHQFTPSAPSFRLDLAFSGGGSIKMARLDYIEVQYRRKLQLSNGELHFNITAPRQSVVNLANCDQNTIIWDITDPVSPSLIRPVVSNGVASFTVYPGNYEYIAFTPDKCNRAITSAVPVQNQDLHALDIPDMLIISPVEYMSAAQTLAAHHLSHDGLKCEILTPEKIYNEFSSATPDVTAFRKLLKMWYDRGIALDSATSDSEEDGSRNSSRIKYCLILARPTFDNKRKMDVTKKASYPIIPIWQSPTGEANTTSFSTDDYIGMLDDSQSFEIGRQKIHVAVGRFPFMSSEEASSLTEKYIKYVTSPETGSWRNKIMMVADDQNYGDHLTQAEDMVKMFSQTEAGKRFRFERVYLDSFPLEQSSRGPSYPQAKEKMLRLWNDGVMMINYIGHASTVSWTHEDLLNWTDMTSFSNKRVPFLYAATCEFGRFDGTNRSGAETLWAYPEAGIIGTVAPSRSVYIDMNGKLTHQVGMSMFSTDADGRGRRIGDIIIEAKNNYPSTENTNKLRYAMIANPAMRIPVPEMNISLTSLNGIPVDSQLSPADYPVLKAMSKADLKGEIRNPDGSLAENFSGLVEIHLYDAENVVSTFGNGSGGVVSYYNDRKTLLYHGIAKAVDGKWSTTALLPSEIENNFAPAQFVFYAYTPDRQEAHGANSRFYVYGTDENATDDTKGPDIESIYLNRQDFTSGDLVHSSPVLMARVSDPSGINLSDAGIGHSMTLVLDDKTYFTDVNTCFAPDPEDFTAGNITYPISQLAPGKHTLRLIVWDNARNSSSASIDFDVAAAKNPEIFELYTDASPAKTNVNFTLSTDRPMASVDCLIEVFDLNGKKVWSSDNIASTDIQASLSIPWNLCDRSGVRVPRGIYVYRATITSPEGPAASKSGKLAVAAQ